MGDNGYFLGERQLAGKWLLYDNSIRVPLIVFDPRLKKQKDSDDLALNIDIPSTILDLAGIPQPKVWHGKSLIPIIKNPKTSFERDTILIEHLWEFGDIPPSEGIRTKDWKYFRYVNDRSYEELYNLKDDPKEINNLAKDLKYAYKLASFRKKTNSLLLELSDDYSKGPSNLIVEWMENTAGATIIDSNPEYGWVVPEGAVSQSAYQILVASSSEKIDNNIGDVWNSGQIKSNSSTEIEHGGTRLNSRGTYYWKVRIWDRDNRLSRYSQPQMFTMGYPK
jgi:hypothetical protein